MGLLTGWPLLAGADGVELRLGAFFPRGDSGAREPNRYDLFKDHTEVHAVSKSDWTGATGGLEVNLNVARGLELGFSMDGYGRSIPTHYRKYTHSDDSEIPQTLELTMVPIGLTVRWLPTQSRRAIAPYIAAGVDIVPWKYEAFGEFIDFGQRSKPIDYAEFKSEGVAAGAHVALGVRVPLTYDLSLTAEGRYQWAEQDMGDDFAANRIDLSGASATIGLRLRF
jgi:hypothetical protein